jgi:hypothetical protein
MTATPRPSFAKRLPRIVRETLVGGMKPPVLGIRQRISATVGPMHATRPARTTAMRSRVCAGQPMLPSFESRLPAIERARRPTANARRLTAVELRRIERKPSVSG